MLDIARFSRGGSVPGSGLLALFLFACGSAQTPPPRRPVAVAAPPPPAPVETHASGQREVTARVGEAGGTLTLSDGAQMRVAAGSLGDNTEVEFRIVEDVPLFRYRSELEPLGPVLFASPPTALLDDGFLEVSFPATTLPGELRPDQLALAVEQEIPERVNTLGAPEVRWQYVPAIRDNERVLARINVIPGMRMRFVVYR